MNTYLFVLCPPFSGSTLLWQLVGTSDQVSLLPSEGQFVPEVSEEMRRAPWDATTRFGWPRIKGIWDGCWDRSKPILVEKSPPNLMRVDEVIQHFQPVRFLVMVRDPYAHCESLMRRSGMTATEAAEFSAMCLRRQMMNAQSLDGSLQLTYEELVGDPVGVADRICRFLPEIGTLDCSRSFKIHAGNRAVKQGIVDLNRGKLASISPKQLAQMSAEFGKHQDVLTFWGYTVVSPSWRHALAFRASRWSSRMVASFKTARHRLAAMVRRIAKLKA